MKKIFIPSIIILSATVLILLISAIPKINQKEKQPIPVKVRITASFYPLYFLASEIGGEKADVYNLTPGGSEPHDYEPTAGDIVGMEKSNIILLNGGGLEAWGGKMADNLKGKNISVVTVGSGLFTQNREENGKTVTDVHIWLSPEIYKKEAEKVLESLQEADRGNRAYYRTRADKLISALDILQEKYKTGLADCRHRDLITSHAAFGYLAKAYGLNQISVAGLSPESEPSSRKMTEIIELARDRGVKYIFSEKLLSPKLAETIASEIGAGILLLDPLEGISGDDLKKGADYFSVMENNLRNIKLALECKN